MEQGENAAHHAQQTAELHHGHLRRIAARVLADKNARTAHPGGKKLRLEREAGEDAAELRSFK